MSKRDERIESEVGWVYWLMPVVPLVLIGLLSKRLFVRRHAQQALMLGMGFWLSWLISSSFYLGCFFAASSVLVLWFGGGFLGIRQVKRGDCWLMRFRGEVDELPRPRTRPSEGQPQEVPPAIVASPPYKLDSPLAVFSRGKALAEEGQRELAVDYFLLAYRNSDLELRIRAVAELDKLGEVEIF